MDELSVFVYDKETKSYVSSMSVMTSEILVFTHYINDNNDYAVWVTIVDEHKERYAVHDYKTFWLNNQ